MQQTVTQEFKPGDCVMLKSGGLRMMVSIVDGDLVHCDWMNRHGQIENVAFRKNFLVLIRDAQSGSMADGNADAASSLTSISG